MQNRCFSLLPECPDGFQKQLPEEYNFSGNNTAVLTEINRIEEIKKRAGGSGITLIITISGLFSSSELTREIYHITISEAMLPDLAALAGFWFDSLSGKNDTDRELIIADQKRRLDYILEGTNAGTWEWNIQTGETIFNQRWAEIIGYNLEEIEPVSIDTWIRFAHPDDLKESKRLLQDCFDKTSKYYEYECRMKHKNGEWIWVLDRGEIATWTEDGKPEWMYGTHQEITERKKAEHELIALQDLLSNMINSMPSILIGVDKEISITQWNKEAAKHTGVPEEQAVGQKLLDIFPEMAKQIENIKKAILDHNVFSETNILCEKNSKTIYHDITVYPLITTKTEGAVIRVDDITERVRLEELMIQSEKMLSVGGLATGMAHEINNPLGGMIQTASVMSDRLSDPQIKGNLKAAEEAGVSIESIFLYMEKRNIFGMLDRIKNSGKRAAEIVQNMLSFARKSSSKNELCSIPELLDQTIEIAGTDYDLKKKYDFRKIEIIREYKKNIPEIPCEKSKIQQAFLNILRNGAEAMQENEQGNPAFTLRVTHLKESGSLHIEIEDNGPGITEETRKRVFEPFFTTKPPDRGTGLGLSVAYFIITENHNGKMWVESIPDRFTNFIIELPG